MPPLLQLQKLQGKGDGGMKGGKKEVSLHRVLADRRSRVRAKQAFWDIL